MKTTQTTQKISNCTVKRSTFLASSLVLVTLASAPFGGTPAAQASSLSRSIHTESRAAGSQTAWGPNGAATCASGVHYGFGYAGGCGSVYSGQNGSYSGFHSNGYNTQTGNGYHNAAHNSTYNGNSYGYNTQRNYTYTQGSGVSGSTSINTQNNGSYTCSFSTQSGCTK